MPKVVDSKASREQIVTVPSDVTLKIKIKSTRFDVDLDEPELEVEFTITYKPCEPIFVGVTSMFASWEINTSTTGVFPGDAYDYLWDWDTFDTSGCATLTSSSTFVDGRKTPTPGKFELSLIYATYRVYWLRLTDADGVTDQLSPWSEYGNYHWLWQESSDVYPSVTHDVDVYLEVLIKLAQSLNAYTVRSYTQYS